MEVESDLVEQILKETEECNKNDYDLTKYNVDELLLESDEEIIQSLREYFLSFHLENFDEFIQSLGDHESKPASTADSLSKLNEELTLPQYENTLDLIDYLELGLIKEKINNTKSLFHLYQYSTKSTLKINSLEIEPQTEVSKAIFKLHNILITCMMVKNDLIVIGNSIGEIKLYSLKDKKLIKILTPDKANAHQVNCVDFTEDGSHLLVGHGNGTIAFWDVNAGNCKLSIKDVFTSSCLAVKFYKIEGKLYYFFASDLDGNLVQIVIKNIAFFWRVDTKKTLYSQPKNPTYLIKLITFTEEQKQAFPHLTGTPQAVIFGSIQNIQIFIIENEIKRLWIVERPSYIKDTNPPDASVGIGKPPIDINVRSDTIKPQLLLAISWGRIIYVHMVPVITGIFGEPTNLGYFVNSSQIFRMGFLTNSLIYFFDSTKFIKVIDTRQINIGNVKISPILNEPEVPPKNNEAQLDDGRLVDPEIKPQFIQDGTGKQCTFYLHSIVENGKYLHVLGKRTLYNGMLLNWESCLNSLKRESEKDWMEVLTKGIDIYQSKMPALSDIPQDDVIRKKVLGSYLQKEILQYVDLSMKDTKKDIKESISKIIEFCIEIEAFNYLLENIEPQFEEKNYGDLFLAELEPFILCDKIRDVELSTDKIIKIIDVYKKNKNYDLLSQLLIHLNIQSIDNETIRNLCEEISLLNPLIYIYNHGKQEDYFEPINNLFNQFQKAEAFESGETLYSYFAKTKSISALQSTKQYVGYKILWYIKMCILGKKYPDEKMDMGTDKFKHAISAITYWLLKSQVFKVLSTFDAKYYFEILNYIFSEEKLHRILEEESKGKNKEEHLKKINEDGNYLIDISPISLAEFLVSLSNKSNDETIKLYSYEFVAKSSKLVDHSKELALETVREIFTAYKTGNENKNTIVINKTKEELIALANDINILICDSNKFDTKDYNAMLNQCKDTPFDIVLLLLYKKTNDYQEILQLYLKEDAIIPNKMENLFTWINMTLTLLKDKNLEEFNKLKDDICKNICAIGSINIERLQAIVNTWFTDQKDLILKNLEKDSKIQLAYVDLIVKDINKELLENENNLDEEYDKVKDILKLHITLLCKENRKDEILPNLKINPLYPLDDCLSIIKEHDVLDATIFLYQKKGASQEALQLSINSLSSTFQRIKDNLQKPTSEFNDNIDTMKKKDFRTNLAICIEVCEHNQKTEEGLWFVLLDQLYMFSYELKKETKITNVYAFNQLKEQLSQDIKDLLETMTNYVGIKSIINKLTEESNSRDKQQAEFKEFKDLLMKMLASYSNLTEILESAKQLLTNSVLINENEYIRLRNSGNGFLVKQCGECKEDLIKTWRTENVLVFYCGHILHEHCAYRDEKLDDFVCKVCRKNEIEDSITSMSDKDKKKKEKDTEEEEEKESEEMISMNVKAEKSEDRKEMLKRMKDFDKRNLENTRVLIENSMLCLKDEQNKKKEDTKE